MNAVIQAVDVTSDPPDVKFAFIWSAHFFVGKNLHDNYCHDQNDRLPLSRILVPYLVFIMLYEVVQCNSPSSGKHTNIFLSLQLG